jgi:inorganic pyrophosphatase
VQDINHIPQAFLDEVAHFFAEYKTLEGKETEILGWENAHKAKEAIEHSVKLYQEL